MYKTLKKIAILAVLTMISASCAPRQPDASATLEPSQPVEIPATQPTVGITETPAPQSTPGGISSGAALYDDGKNIVSVNPDTGETKTLVSREELQLLLTEDKSAESYTYGYARPIPIALSPDFTKALVTLCASLDDRLRCIFDNYVYRLESKTAVKLPTPSGAYGVYWQWSPDGSKLAGADWSYDQSFYKVNRFYAVNSDGTGLVSLAPVTNDHWQIAWHPASLAVHPLTFVTNFQSLFADGSKGVDIPITGLEWNDKIECLAYSPDAGKVAFIVQSEALKEHRRVYIAQSDFTGANQAAEYDIDSGYLCNAQWSPDQRLVLFRYEYDPRAETGAEQPDKESGEDKTINVETGSLIEPPQDRFACGWTPGSDLIYEKKGIAGEEGGIELSNPADSASVNVPAGLQNIVRHCPIAWLDRELPFNVPVGLAVGNACHPGSSIQDEPDEVPIPELFDFTGASTTLDGETLNVTISMLASNADLSSYLTPDVTDFLNGWDILVDVDNNALSGDRHGIEYALSIGVRPGASPTLEGVLLKYDPAGKTFAKLSDRQPSLNAAAKTVSVTGSVPGITVNSRLVFLSRMVDKARNAVIGDRLCN